MMFMQQLLGREQSVACQLTFFCPMYSSFRRRSSLGRLQRKLVSFFCASMIVSGMTESLGIISLHLAEIRGWLVAPEVSLLERPLEVVLLPLLLLSTVTSIALAVSTTGTRFAGR